MLIHLAFTAGPIPTSISYLTGLTTLTLHANLLTGKVPSFANLSWLVNLTLFKNTNLGGKLVLPSAPLQTVIAFKNRLSCELEAEGNSSILNTKYYELFGQFSAPTPQNKRLIESAACLFDYNVINMTFCMEWFANRSVGMQALLLPGSDDCVKQGSV